MEEFKNNNNEDLYTQRIRAGKRTYFIDVKATRNNDYFLSITESKRKFEGDGFIKHKIFLYKEDFNKFLEGLSDAIKHVKTELMPEYDFEKFDNRDDDNYSGSSENGNASSSVDKIDNDESAASDEDSDKKESN